MKIDRLLVRDLGHDRVAAALVQAILAMARGMDMLVIAEGIETEEQAKLLRVRGCEFGQGFGLGRAAPRGAGSVPRRATPTESRKP